MAKVIRTTDNDYRIIVANGGTIYLDTTGGEYDGAGKVVVRGDLEVKGDTTTVESTITTISDNIIVLSNGNTNSGLPASLDRPYSSGIAIDRGLLAPARWVYDDSISWALGGTVGIGTWVATQGDLGSEQRLPLATPGIVAGGNLYVSTGAGVITVTGTNNYEEKIWRYVSGAVVPDPVTGAIIIDDDNIPNAKAIKDFVDYSIASVEIDRIAEDNTSVQINDKNNIIAAIDTVGSRTVIRTTNSHGFDPGDTITITGVFTSPTDSIINSLNGTWVITDTPTRTTIELNHSTTGGDPTKYVANSGVTVGLETNISVTVEGSNVANFYSNRLEIGGIQIRENEVSTFNSNDTLVLSAPGTGVIKLNDTIEIPKTPGDDEPVLAFDPSAPLDGIRVYSKTPGTGKSGLYFINEENYKDELISKNRALLYGMLF